MSLKNQNTTSDYLPWNELVSLIHKLGRDGVPKFQLLVALGAFLGLRISDLLTLRWENILGKNKLVIREKKTGKERILSINSDLQKIIIDTHKNIQPQSEFVFTNKRGNVMSTQYINRKLKEFKVIYKLSIENISTHTFRKSFGREYWKRNGYSDKSLIILSEMFSHSSIATTKRYLGIKEQEIMEAYEVLTL